VSRSEANGASATTAVAFVASAKSALGKLQRVTNVAAAMRARRPPVSVDLVTNSALGAEWARRSALYRDIAFVDGGEMAACLSLRKPGAVVVGSIVVPGLEHVDTPLCLILREVIPSELARFRLPGGRRWDLVIVPNPADEWLPDPDLVPAKRLEAVGWIYRRPVASPRGNPSPPGGDRQPVPQRTVLVSSGGGSADRERAALTEEIARLLDGLRESAGAPLRILQARGPFVRRAWMIPGVDEVIEPGVDLHNLFSEVDLVISTAGYNSVLELACTDVPVLLVPIGRYSDDQYKRAKQWGERVGMRYDPRSPERAVQWMASVVDGRLRRAPFDPGPSGAVASAELIEELLRAHCPR
jgi:hypothetical protein